MGHATGKNAEAFQLLGLEQFFFMTFAILEVLAYLVLAGIHVRAAYASTGVAHCLKTLDPPPQSACFAALWHFKATIAASSYGGGGAFLLYLNLVPGLFGAFLGAPLLARELEHGTHRFAWTQSLPQQRWLTYRLLVAGIAGALAELAISVAATYARSPIDRLNGRFLPESFNLEGIAPLGFVLFGFTLGVAAGAVLRRTVPAIAVTVVAYVAVRGLVQKLRAHYLPAKSIARAADAFGPPTGGRGSWDLSYPFSHTMYQPAGRYWPFQLIEFSIYLCLSAALIALAIHLVRH